MYRLMLIERAIVNGIARLFHSFGMAEKHYLAPLTRISGVSNGPIHIVFVCKGNLCRSPYGEWAFKSAAGDRWADRFVLASLGVNARPGRAAYPAAIDAARERGIDLSAHTTAKTESESLQKADLIIGMEPSHMRAIRAIEPGLARKSIYLGALLLDQGEKLCTPDPYGKPPGDFRACFDKIDRAIAALLGRFDGAEVTE